MKAEEAEIGATYRSTQNHFGIHYKLIKKLKTVCWVEEVETKILFKGVRYYMLRKVGV